LQDALADARFETAFCGHIHPTFQKLLQVVLETAQVEKGSAWFKLDEEIDIAVFIGVAARDRAEDAHIPRAVLGAQL
jgi:hypothetical protein